MSRFTWVCVPRFLVILCLGIGFGPNVSKSTAADQLLQPEDTIKAYFNEYCYRCHGENKHKGDRRFDQIPADLKAGSDGADLLEEALDAINRGEMPPQKKGVSQPTIDETRRVVAALTRKLTALSGQQSRASTTLRRLNRFEYVNTMRDLLGLRPEFFASTSDFPVDATEHGFDNNGEALTLSDHQLRRYLEVAQSALDAASYFGVEKPKEQHWHFEAKDFNGVTSYVRAPVTWRLLVDEKYLEIGHGQPSERSPNYVKRFAADGGVPADGWYTISVVAAAANRLDHGYEHGEFEKYKTQPLKMALWIAPDQSLLSKNAADQRHLIKIWDLPDGDPETFSDRIWLKKGAVPFVSWTNGVSSKGNIRRVAEKYHPEVIRANKTQLDAASLGNAEAQAAVKRLKGNAGNLLLSEVYQGPRIRVWSMDIDGPVNEPWPPASHQRLFGKESDPGKVDVGEAILNLANRAFRRPVSPDQVRHYVEYVNRQIETGVAPSTAIKIGMAAVLTSPRFLYLDEGDEEVAGLLDAFELATRLSYFLWSSMPDAELIRSASSGQLSSPQGLHKQVERMLGDPRSEAFVEHFTDTWLRINTLGSMPPDLKTFSQYYRDRLEDGFKTETRLFFADLLARNASILNLLDSDYTFVNDSLASHYGIDGVVGESFRRVDLDPEHHRGGLLGQGSVLTLTANGIETSPVVRGIWVLENLLGTPPPPPPPDVEPLEPDTRGTTTIREQLEKHRQIAVCADCHRKIDPPGFALEFYDPIGGYRSSYATRRGEGVPVDGAGELPTGESFRDERELKQLLLQRKDRFAKTLAEKLLVYGTGRSMSFRDDAAITAISDALENGGYGLRDLVHAVVESNLFQSR